MRESLISILKKATANNKKPKFTNYLDIINEIIDLTNNENNIDNREEKFQDIQISLEQIKEKSKEDIIEVKEKLREILEYFVQDLYTTKNDLTKAEIFKIIVNDYRICGDEEYRLGLEFKVRFDIVKPTESGEEIFYKQPELALSNNTKILEVELINPFSELEQLEQVLKTLGEVESNTGVNNLE